MYGIVDYSPSEAAGVCDHQAMGVLSIDVVPSTYGKWYWSYSIARSLNLLAINGVGDREVEPSQVLLRNANRGTKPLKACGTLSQARRAARRYSARLASVGDEEFCRRYGISAEFIADTSSTLACWPD